MGSPTGPHLPSSPIHRSPLQLQRACRGPKEEGPVHPRLVTGLLARLQAAILSAGAGLSIAAISNELYVFNEETIVAFALLTVFYGVGKYGSPAYAEWAQGQQDKMKGILNQARENHTKSVQERIESVKEFGGVIDITKTLFEVSKETAKLEAEAYELEQKTAIASEAKSVLDSWVRYEQSVKQRQQKELADSVIAKVEKELSNPKVLQQILDQSVKDVERLVSQKA